MEMGHLLYCCVLVVCIYNLGVSEARQRRHWRHKSMPIQLVRDFDVEGYLKHFGYMKEIPAGIMGDRLVDVGERDNQVKDAVRKFQRFYGLRESGRVDHRTMMWMKKPRCGVNDVTESERFKRSYPQRYTHLGSKWHTNRLTWKLTRPTHKLTLDDQRRTINSAFKLWEEKVPLAIRETQGEPDMEIFFARGEHGDGNVNAFDGKNHVLAHAFGPGESKISGDAHFDNDEEWSLDPEEGSDFLVVAAHEFGHSLGLGHSRDKKALMFPAYQKQENLQLGNDDIRALQSLYGARTTNTGNTQTPRRTRPPTRRRTTPARRPRPTQRPRIQPTRAPRPRPTQRPRIEPTRAPRPVPTTPTPLPCNVQFDAIVEGSARSYYALHQGSAYKFRESGLEPDFPKPVGEVFQGAPDTIDMAFSIARTSRVYIIKGNQVWRYTYMTLDEGYPMEFNRNSFPETPRFAISLVDDQRKSRVILFGDQKFWFYSFDEKVSSIPMHYDISSNWRGIPSDVKYSVRWSDNNYYLVTSKSHVVFDHNRRTASPEGEQNGVPRWLDTACSAVMEKIGNNGNHLQPYVIHLLLFVLITRMLSQ